jgi:hypothetical protein
MRSQKSDDRRRRHSRRDVLPNSVVLRENAMNNVLLSVFMVSWLTPSALGQSQANRSDSLPDYRDFSVGEIFQGQPLQPILFTAEDKSYRTVSREGAGQGPDFAGHCTIVERGEGSSVITFADGDAISG